MAIKKYMQQLKMAVAAAVVIILAALGIFLTISHPFSKIISEDHGEKITIFYTDMTLNEEGFYEMKPVAYELEAGSDSWNAVCQTFESYSYKNGIRTLMPDNTIEGLTNAGYTLEIYQGGRGIYLCGKSEIRVESRVYKMREDGSRGVLNLMEEICRAADIKR